MFIRYNGCTVLFLVICVILLFESGNFAPGKEGLYGPDDNVDILNVDNYKSIYNIDQCVFLEFYSHWCGACNISICLIWIK